jgi:hypothetical protein
MISLLIAFVLLLPVLLVVVAYLLGTPTGGAVTGLVRRSLRRVAPAAGVTQHSGTEQSVGGRHGEEY